MNIHYVIWVALAVVAIAAVYSLYNYLLHTAINYFVSSTEEALRNLASIQPGEERSAVIAIPWGVKIEACSYNPITGICTCQGDSGPVKEKDARGCLKIVTQDRVTYIGTPYPIELQGQTELYVGTYQIRAYTQPPHQACTTMAQFLGRIDLAQELVGSQEICNTIKQATNALSTLKSLGLQNDLINALEELNNQCNKLGQVQTTVRHLWSTFCTPKIVIVIEKYK